MSDEFDFDFEGEIESGDTISEEAAPTNDVKQPDVIIDPSVSAVGFMATQLLNSPVRAFPFPHLNINHALLPDSATELIKNVPEDNYLSDTDDPKRKFLNLKDAENILKWPDQEKINFWGGVVTQLCNGAFKHILSQAFFQGIAPNMVSDELFLIKDNKGFTEQPHTRPSIDNHLLTLYIFLNDSPQPVDIFHLNHLPENKKQYVWVNRFVNQAGTCLALIEHPESYFAMPATDSDRWLIKYSLYASKKDAMNYEQEFKNNISPEQMDEFFNDTGY